MEALNGKGWLSCYEIEAKTGIQNSHVRRALKTKAFEHLHLAKRETGCMNGGARFIQVWKLVDKSVNPAQQAINLAKKHKGFYGQLFWSIETYEKVYNMDYEPEEA